MDVETLRLAALKHINEISASNPQIGSPIPLPFANIQKTTFEALLTALNLNRAVKGGQQQIFEDLLILEAFLAEKVGKDSDPACRDAVISVRESVATAILPPDSFAGQSPYAIEEEKKFTANEVARFRALSFTGVNVLSYLERNAPLSEDEDAVSVFTSLAAFSDPEDAWNCVETSKAASLLWESIKVCKAPKSLAALLTQMLRERIKPAFTKTRDTRITDQARKAIDPLPSSSTGHADDATSKPWKYRDVYLVRVLRWILDQLPSTDSKFTETNWPLLVPPLLALIDDTTIAYKAAGCINLSTFLRKVPSAMLERTGLGEVFESAITPSLMYLPSLTEEADSLKLLSAAYPALIELARARFPGDEHRQSRVKALDRIMRYGILKGYAHAGEHAKIAEMLVRQVTVLVDEMGIDVVKFLKNVLPLLAVNLADPFATAYPPLLQASVKSIRAIIVTAWPRVAYHRGDILQGLTICWCRIEEQETESEELRAIKEDIKDTVRLLTVILEMDVNVAEDYRQLIDSDNRLQGLLAI